MELMFQWFWLVKLILLLATVYVIYDAFYVNKFKSKLKNFLVGVLILFAV